MANFILSLIIFAVFYAPFKFIEPLWAQESLPKWFRYIGGILAWLCLASATGPVIAVVKLIMEILKHPNMGQGMEFCVIVIAAGALAKLLDGSPEILNFAQVKPFLFQSLRFETYNIKRGDLFVELDKHNVRKIHKETTGKDLVEPKSRSREIPHIDPDQALKELEEIRARPLRSVHLADELNRLKGGEMVSIFDTFKLNASKFRSNDLYEDIFAMKIEPGQRRLSFSVNMKKISPETGFNADRLFRLKQDVYDLLQALNAEAWLKAYGPFFDSIRVTCHRNDTDTFGLPIQQPFLSLEIQMSKLQERAGKLFVATELDKISNIVFDQGKPIT